MFGWARSDAIGIDEGPPTHDNYKRAVYRQPPARFTVEMLPPAKQGPSYSYGMRICAILRGDRSSTSSGSSTGSAQEYEIWRRWEDCLWFQDSIELEYGRLARMKRQRLKAGKGVKKNGFYLQDQASSWESLPPGPEPNSVAQDIHAYVPRLTKKGTLFKASQETIDQRQAEISAFVAALFKEDAPTLLQDLRMDRIVTDFFGYWRRDHDLAMKQNKAVKSGRAPSRTSITGSILSSYFAPSLGSLAPDAASARTRASSDSSATARPPMSPTPRRKSNEHTSSDSASSTSSGDSASSNTVGHVPAIVGDAPLDFSHNPISASTPHSALAALPEDAELAPKDNLSVPRPRPRKASTGEDTQTYRNTTIFGSVQEGIDFNDPKSIGFTRGARESWQTTGSVSTYLEGLNMIMPSSPAEIQHRRNRNSMASVATFMTEASVDAVIPRNIIAEVSTARQVKRAYSGKDGRRGKGASVLSFASDATVERWSDDESHVIRKSFLDFFPLPESQLPAGFGKRPEAPIPPDSPPDTPVAMSRSLPTDDIVYEERSPSEMRMNADMYQHPPSRLAVRNDMPSDVSSRNSTASSIFSQASTSASTSTGSATPVPPSPTVSITPSMLSTSSKLPFPRSHIPASQPQASSSHITVKVAHNESIIMVRVPRDASIEDVRTRVKDKFSTQEGIELSEAFTLAIALSSPLKPLFLGSRARSNSFSPLSNVQMRLVVSQADWDKAVDSMEGPKLALKVLDTFA